jgi:hypothetical protein
MKLGIGRLINIAGISILLALGACTPSQSAAMGPGSPDDAQTQEEAKRGTPCSLAGANLSKVCPKLYRSAEYWREFCAGLEDAGESPCPVRLSKVKSCAEAEKVSKGCSQ